MSAVGRGWKNDPCFEISHLIKQGGLDSLLGSYSIPGIDFSLITRSKILAMVLTDESWGRKGCLVGSVPVYVWQWNYSFCVHNISIVILVHILATPENIKFQNDPSQYL
jgi:hypothetical protein